VSVKVKNFLLIWITSVFLLSPLVFFSYSFISSRCSKQSILSRISQAAGRQVKADMLTIRWHALNPQIIIRNVSVSGDAGGGELNFSTRVQVSLLESLWRQRLILDHVDVSAVNLDVWHNDTGHLVLSVNGKTPWLKSGNVSSIHWSQLLVGLPLRGMTISNSQINWYQQQQPVLKLHLMSLSVKPRRHALVLQADGSLANHAQLALQSVVDLSTARPRIRYVLKAKHIAISPALLKNNKIRPWLSIDGALGKGSVNLSGWWMVGAKKKLTAEVDFPDLSVSHLVVRNVDHTIAAINLKPYRCLQAKLDLSSDLTHAAVKVDYLNLTSPRHNLVLHEAAVHILKGSKGWRLAKIESHAVNVASLYSWLAQSQYQHPIPAWIFNLHASGEVEKLALHWNSLGKLDVAQAKLKNVSFIATHNFPGMSHLNGKVKYSSSVLTTRLHSSALLVNAPHLFASQHSYGHFNEESSTHFYGHSWNTVFRKVYLQDGNVNLALSAFVSKPVDHGAIVNLLGHFTVKDLSHVQAYLPKKIIKMKLKKWLAMALKGGALQHGVIVWRGPLNNFPHYSKKNTFTVSADLEQGVLHFSPQWPSLTAMQGKIVFHDDGMVIGLKHALIQQYSIDNLRSHIDQFRHPWLFITAQGKGDFKAALSVLNQSPLTIKKQLSALYPSGSTQLHLGLGINLKHHAPVRVRGDVALHGVSLMMPGATLPVKSVFGDVDFTANTVTSFGLKGSVLHRPFEAKILTTQIKGCPYLSVTAAGKVVWSDLIEYYISGKQDLNFINTLVKPVEKDQSALISGQAPLHVNVHIPFSRHLSTVLNIHTSLVGTSLAGLDEYAKSAASSRPSQLRWVFNSDHSSQLNVSSEDKFHAVVKYNKHHDLSLLDLFLGKKSIPLVLSSGVVLSGNINKLDLNQLSVLWHRISSVKAMSKLVQPKLFQLMRVENLHLGKLLYHTVAIRNLTVSLLQNKQAWMLGVNNNLIRGLIRFPKNTHQPWRIYFSKCFLPAFKFKKVLTDYSFLPDMKVDLNQLYWGKSYYQKISFGLHKDQVSSVFHVSNVLIKNSYYTLRASGDWPFAGKSTSHFIGDIATNSFGNLLAKWKVNHLFKSGTGGVGFNVTWQGLPWKPQQKTMIGVVNLYSQYGYVVINPKLQQSINMVRLLNLLGIESLPKHMLTLFTDMANTGIEYNQFQAHLLLNEGQLTFQKAVFSGDNIDMKLNGKVNISQKSLQLGLVVVPKLASSLPLISGFIAGPIAAVSMFMLNKASGNSFGGATAHYYSVTGTVDKPIIIEASASTAKG
jgi:uncharacterized protein (TIGR02099 family)